jgi:hypothetical protein
VRIDDESTNAKRFKVHPRVIIPENSVFLEEKKTWFSVDLDKIPIARGSGVKAVFIRESYKLLYPKLEKSLLKESENRCVSFSGNPGIGKSLFYIYCLRRLMKREFLTDHILLLHSGSRCIEYKKAESCFVECDGDRFKELSRTRTVIRLIDPPVFGTELLGWKGFSILFTSPGLEGLHEFKKGSRMNLFMPPWTLEELLECNKECRLGIKTDLIEERFDEIGGIARHVFDFNLYQSALADLENFMGNKAIINLLDIVKSSGQANPKDYSHRILVMNPSTDFSKYSLGFTSKKVCMRIFEKFYNEKKNDLLKFIDMKDEDNLTASMRGELFERFVISLFKSENEFQVYGVGEHGLISQFTLNFSKLEVSLYDRLEDCDLKDKSKYFVPRSRNNGSYDSLWFDGNTLYIFQITVAKSHSIKLKPMEEVLKAAKRKRVDDVKFVFITPLSKCEGYLRLQDIVGVNNKKVNKMSKAMREIKQTQYVLGLDTSLYNDIPE